MSVIPSHRTATSRQDCIDTWKSKKRISVPTQGGGLMDLWLVNLVEATTLNGKPIDLYVEARASKDASLKRFAVLHLIEGCP
jgi:hypothetical protein